MAQRPQRDHPRICGEKIRSRLSLQAVTGSPPHMRGKAGNAKPLAFGVGITPAYAGKRTLPFTTTKPQEDHPRICGEKETTTQKAAVIQGSPPHMRGKDAVCTHDTPSVRITPAYAGKSSLSATTQNASGGSPPHMRGKAAHRPFHTAHAGITPAYAGKRRLQPKGTFWGRDHPRICGEKGGRSFAPLPCPGSPPHMRGKVIHGDGGMCSPGITPAYAGKSSRSARTSTNCRDHPRICGEKRS